MAALELNPAIGAYRDEIEAHVGYTTEYLESLGLSKSLLKAMERQGMAVRARTPEKSGHKTKWVIIITGRI